MYASKSGLTPEQWRIIINVITATIALVITFFVIRRRRRREKKIDKHIEDMEKKNKH